MVNRMGIRNGTLSAFTNQFTNVSPLVGVLVLGALLSIVSGCGKGPDETPSKPAPVVDALQPTKATAPEPAAAIAKTVDSVTNTVSATADKTRASATSLLNNIKAATNSAPVTEIKPAAPVVDVPTTPVAAPSVAGLAGLSQGQLTDGLKEALGKGVQQAISMLGHDGGFLTNVDVKIPLPQKLQKVQTALHAINQDKYADELVTTMNHAAEQAVPAAAVVFADAVKNMNVADAQALLTGPNDAATQYFRKTTQTNLYAKFYPIVQKATSQTGVMQAYKSLTDKAKSTQSFGGLDAALGGALSDKDALDVDAYVTNKTMDGLFKMVAAEEAQIRQNPVARTTDLLNKVFGALK
jgi:hypothetical protein